MMKNIMKQLNNLNKRKSVWSKLAQTVVENLKKVVGTNGWTMDEHFNTQNRNGNMCQIVQTCNTQKTNGQPSSHLD